MQPKKIAQAAEKERAEFSSRLQKALRDAGYAPDSPTQLAREFNIRNKDRTITVHAARKWLVGQAIPTQEKLRLLSEWLGVSANWLRFGGDNTKDSEHERIIQPLPQISRVEMSVIENLRCLDLEQQDLVLKLVLSLAQAHSKSRGKRKHS